jgi:ABC-type nitrate/sulfonate/bicarbonate transport system substrate-binding protein
MKYLMVITDKPSFDFIVTRDIKSFKDLKGKSIGSGNTSGDQPDQAVRAILSAHAIDPDKDVKLVFSGGTTPDRNLLLRTGHVAGTLLTGEYSLKAQKDGYVKLAYSGDYLRSLGSAVLVLEENLRQNPDEAYRFVRATLKGLRFFRERKALSLPILDQFLGLKDLEAAERDYDFYVRSMTENGSIGEETMRQAIDQAKTFFKIPKEKEIRPEEVFDLSLVKKANEELKAKGWSP